MTKADMKDIRGMPEIVALLERAVVHHRNLLLCGPPGIGKTMLARRVPTIMPRLTEKQRAELYGTHRAARLLAAGGEVGDAPPFRAPHHSASAIALVGNKRNGRPGEVQLAAYGVLFLDDLPEFSLRAVEDLGASSEARKPLIIAASLPCPCAFNKSKARACTCHPAQVERHRQRTRDFCFRLHINDFVDIPCVQLKNMKLDDPAENSAVIRKRVGDRIKELCL